MVDQHRLYVRLVRQTMSRIPHMGRAAGDIVFDPRIQHRWSTVPQRAAVARLLLAAELGADEEYQYTLDDDVWIHQAV